MTKDSYPALFHFIHKQMSDISYPASKANILSIAGDRPIKVEWDRSIPLKTLIEPIQKDMFSCAADFYCGLIAALR